MEDVTREEPRPAAPKSSRSHDRRVVLRRAQFGKSLTAMTHALACLKRPLPFGYLSLLSTPICFLLVLHIYSEHMASSSGFSYNEHSGKGTRYKPQ